MQLKVTRIQQQPRGAVPSGSVDPQQRQVDLPFPCCDYIQPLVCVQQTLWDAIGLWRGCEAWTCVSTSHDSVSSLSLIRPVGSEYRGMGPASLQEEREPEKEPKEMESYHCLLQAGSQLETTLQREYTLCWQCSFNFCWPLSGLWLNYFPLLHLT